MDRRIIIVLCLFSIIGLVSAEEKTWTGSNGSDWSNPDNWNPPGVPGKTDEATIPSGSPECTIPSGSVTVKKINVHGTLNISSCHMKIQHLENTGDINVSEKLFVSQLPVTEFGDFSGSTFENKGGAINAHNALLYINADFSNKRNAMDINNYGNIYADMFVCNAEDFSMGKFAGIAGNSIFIHTNGDMQILEGAYIRGNDHNEGHGGSVWIKADEIHNSGALLGGKSDMGRGGSVFITAYSRFYHRGSVRPGSGQSRSGNVYLKANNFDNGGEFGGEQSTNTLKTVSQSLKNLNESAFITIYSDSILCQGDTTRIEGDSVQIHFNNMVIKDIEDHPAAFAWEHLTLSATPGGIFDAAQNNMQFLFNLLINASGEIINIFCDNVVEPAGGLNAICDPGCQIQPADGSLIGADMTLWNDYGVAGESGIQHGVIQNQSTTNQTVQYDISSSKGWITPLSGVTLELTPMAFDSLAFEFTIPEGAIDGETDTVTAILTIGEGFADTLTAIITSVGLLPPLTGLNERDNHIGPEKFHVYPNYPNPFNPTTTLMISLHRESQVTIQIFDMLGRKVKTVSDEILKAGNHKIRVQMDDLPGGTYLCQFELPGFKQSRKLVLVK